MCLFYYWVISLLERLACTGRLSWTMDFLVPHVRPYTWFMFWDGVGQCWCKRVHRAVPNGNDKLEVAHVRQDSSSIRLAMHDPNDLNGAKQNWVAQCVFSNPGHLSSTPTKEWPAQTQDFPIMVVLIIPFEHNSLTSTLWVATVITLKAQYRK